MKSFLLISLFSFVSFAVGIILPVGSGDQNLHLEKRLDPGLLGGGACCIVVGAACVIRACTRDKILDVKKQVGEDAWNKKLASAGKGFIIVSSKNIDAENWGQNSEMKDAKEVVNQLPTEDRDAFIKQVSSLTPLKSESKFGNVDDVDPWLLGAGCVLIAAGAMMCHAGS